MNIFSQSIRAKHFRMTGYLRQFWHKSKVQLSWIIITINCGKTLNIHHGRRRQFITGFKLIFELDKIGCNTIKKFPAKVMGLNLQGAL